MCGCRRTCILSIFRLSLSRWQKLSFHSRMARKDCPAVGGLASGGCEAQRTVAGGQGAVAAGWLPCERRTDTLELHKYCGVHGRRCSGCKFGPPASERRAGLSMGGRLVRRRSLGLRWRTTGRGMRAPKISPVHTRSGDAVHGSKRTVQRGSSRRYGLGQRAHAVASRGDEGAVVSLRQGALCKTYLLQTARNTALYVPSCALVLQPWWVCSLFRRIQNFKSSSSSSIYAAKIFKQPPDNKSVILSCLFVFEFSSVFFYLT